MFRLRRYRVFVIFAALTIFALYRFGSPTNWETPSAHSVAELKEHLNLRGKTPTTREKAQQEILRPKPAEPPVIPAKPNANDAPSTKVTPPPVAAITKPVQKAPPPADPSSSPGKPEGPPTSVIKGGESGGRVRVQPNPPKDDAMKPILEQGEGRWEPTHLPTAASPIRWVKPTEHFPIPSGSTILLPTGTPKPIAKIQATFANEDELVAKDRHEKRALVVEAFKHAWEGYKANAWGKDELMPVSGKSKNPFSGWGATLVDSLDTMWMMGLKTEFEEGVEYVKKLDFKSSRRGDIPIFETTIRYLGGLLGAYDVTEGKYKILLDKAVELAEIMMGAFDTPNRMPDTFYQWKP
jgi:mannosyl-oligosaccharide alpha-1,2-mannosidase